MTERQINIIVISIGGILAFAILGTFIWLYLFSRAVSWRPPDDYRKPENHIKQDSIQLDSLRLRNGMGVTYEKVDSINLKTLQEYLKREQYGSAPLENGKFWKSKDQE